MVFMTLDFLLYVIGSTCPHVALQVVRLILMAIFSPALYPASPLPWLLLKYLNIAAHAAASEFLPVSYTHLTLPTSDLV